LQHIATHCNTLLQHTVTHCNTLRHTTRILSATHYNTLQHTPTLYNTLQQTLQHSVTHCNTLLQHNAATHCNTARSDVRALNYFLFAADNDSPRGLFHAAQLLLLRHQQERRVLYVYIYIWHTYDDIYMICTYTYTRTHLYAYVYVHIICQSCMYVIYRPIYMHTRLARPAMSARRTTPPPLPPARETGIICIYI